MYYRARGTFDSPGGWDPGTNDSGSGTPPGEGDLFPSFFTDADTFFTPVLAVGAAPLTAALFTNSNVFQSFAIAFANEMDAALFDSSAETVFHVPEVAGIAVGVGPDLFEDADTFYAATVDRGAITLVPSLFTQNSAFFTSVISTGAAGLETAEFTDVDTFFTHLLEATFTLQPPVHGDGDTFYTHALQPGAITITQASTFTDSDTFYEAVIPGAGSQALSASLFTNTSSFFPATVTRLNTLVPPLFTASNTFYTHIENSAPEITSGTTADAVIGDTDPFYTITATDQEDDTITYSITGADAIWFTVDANTGEISLA